MTTAQGLVALLKLGAAARKHLSELLAAARKAGEPGLFDDQNPQDEPLKGSKGKGPKKK